MYRIVARRYAHSVTDFVIIARNLTLKEAATARQTSGDLVVHEGNLLTVPCLTWLWDWEKANPDCFAMQAIRHDRGELKKLLRGQKEGDYVQGIKLAERNLRHLMKRGFGLTIAVKILKKSMDHEDVESAWWHIHRETASVA